MEQEIVEISIKWHIDDVHCASSMNDLPYLTEDQASMVLQIIERMHDANIGINWDVISYNIEQYCRDNNISKGDSPKPEYLQE